MPTEEQTYRQMVKDQLDRIEAQTTKTNGSVRRLYLYLVLVAGLAVGMGVNNGSLILHFLGL